MSEAASRVPITPPVCCHCGKLMQFVGAYRSVLPEEREKWEETWRCPEGAWSFRRTVPAPPRYRLKDVPPVRRRRPARPKR